MTEKRFRVYKVIGSFHEWSIEDTATDKVVFGTIMHKYEADRLCEKLNELAEENEQLLKEKIDVETKLYKANEELLMQMDYDAVIKQNGENEVEIINLKKENEQLKHNNKMLSMKMSEVSTKYRLLKEFSEDTNPNEAVGTVLHELMMITKEYR